MENTPETTNPYESQESRVELLETLVEHFDENIEPKLREYLMTSDIIFKEDGLYNEDIQREKLLNLNAEIVKVKSTMSKLLAEHESFIPSIGIIYQQLDSVIGLLKEAPDKRYSEENLAIKFGGAENIPGGRFTYKQTREGLIKLDSMFNGLAAGVKFLK